MADLVLPSLQIALVMVVLLVTLRAAQWLVQRSFDSNETTSTSSPFDTIQTMAARVQSQDDFPVYIRVPRRRNS